MINHNNGTVGQISSATFTEETSNSREDARGARAGAAQWDRDAKPARGGRDTITIRGGRDVIAAREGREVKATRGGRDVIAA